MDASRHLHSVLHPFACLWIGLPWRTFTCPGQYSQAFGYYAASVLPPAHWHFRAPEHGKAVWEFASSDRWCVSDP
jgi:hypothetical protein